MLTAALKHIGSGLVLAHLFGGPLLAKSDCLLVQGGVQFWQRPCFGNICSAPEALGEPQVIELCISPPQRPSEIGWAREIVIENDLQLSFDVYWKTEVSNPEIARPHLVFQQRLIRNLPTHIERIAECSIYLEQDRLPRFPVGACTGYVGSNEDQRQIGASFLLVDVE